MFDPLRLPGFDASRIEGGLPGFDFLDEEEPFPGFDFSAPFPAPEKDDPGLLKRLGRSFVAGIEDVKRLDVRAAQAAADAAGDMATARSLGDKAAEMYPEVSHEEGLLEQAARVFPSLGQTAGGALLGMVGGPPGMIAGAAIAAAPLSVGEAYEAAIEGGATRSERLRSTAIAGSINTALDAAGGLGLFGKLRKFLPKKIQAHLVGTFVGTLEKSIAGKTLLGMAPEVVTEVLQEITLETSAQAEYRGDRELGFEDIPIILEPRRLARVAAVAALASGPISATSALAEDRTERSREKRDEELADGRVQLEEDLRESRADRSIVASQLAQVELLNEIEESRVADLRERWAAPQALREEETAKGRELAELTRLDPNETFLDRLRQVKEQAKSLQGVMNLGAGLPAAIQSPVLARLRGLELQAEEPVLQRGAELETEIQERQAEFSSIVMRQKELRDRRVPAVFEERMAKDVAPEITELMMQIESMAEDLEIFRQDGMPEDLYFRNARPVPNDLVESGQGRPILPNQPEGSPPRVPSPPGERARFQGLIAQIEEQFPTFGDVDSPIPRQLPGGGPLGIVPQSNFLDSLRAPAEVRPPSILEPIIGEERVEELFQAEKGIQDEKWVSQIKKWSIQQWDQIATDTIKLPHTRGQRGVWVEFREFMRAGRHHLETGMVETQRKLAKVFVGATAEEMTLFRDAMLVDDSLATLRRLPEGTPLAFDFTLEELELAKPVADAAVANSPRVQEMIKSTRETFREHRQMLSDALRDLSIDDAWLWKYGDSYLHHQVVDLSSLTGGDIVTGSQESLRSLIGKRSFRKERKGSARAINLNYRQAQGYVLAQLWADASLARSLKKMRDHYDISGEVRVKFLEVNEDQQPTLSNPDWWSRKRIRKTHPNESFDKDQIIEEQELLNEGVPQRISNPEWMSEQAVMNEYFPGYIFVDMDLVDSRYTLNRSVATAVAKNLVEEELGSLSFEEAFKALQPNKWILPQQIADQFDHSSRVAAEQRAKRSGRFRTLQRKWKQHMLFGIHRAPKYLTRNLVGDTTKASSAFLLQGGPRQMVLYLHSLPQAFRLTREYVKNGTFSKDPLFEEWVLKHHGMSTQSFDAELDLAEIRRDSSKQGQLGMIARTLEGALFGFKSITKMASALEGMNRFASFKMIRLMLEKNGGNPKANEYFASIPEEIDGLGDLSTKAFWLANDLIGAYDQVSERGQYLRQTHVPFWSFTETMVRSYSRMGTNILMQHPDIAEAWAEKNYPDLMKAAVRHSPEIGRRFAVLAASLMVFDAILWSWNNTVMKDLEDELPKDVRERSHVVFGKVRGQVIYFDRLGVFGEFRDLIGIDDFKTQWVDYLNDRITSKEALSGWLAGYVNRAVNMTTPLGFKGGFEWALGRSTYPEITNARADSRTKIVGGLVGAENEFRFVRDLYRSQDILESLGRYGRAALPRAFIYQHQVGRGAWGDTKHLSVQFLRKLNRLNEGDGSYNSRSAALRDYKEGLALGDEAFARGSLERYLELGGKRSGIAASVKAMSPMRFVPKNLRLAFLASMSPTEKERFNQANAYYRDVLLSPLRRPIQRKPRNKSMESTMRNRR